ncbi:LacI family DNA-binding transcriptional regulator [Microbacterium soli]|uniref:LacI family DNA-binding transcriptional regulator n=1 Tax=Microbacterium soli TaxID=446075 RepID=A0ABP7NC13_9MICO
MARAATSIDVARRAGVSQPTVSRALRDLPNITAATKERVLRAARELDYVPREAGRSLSTPTTRRIAVVSDALTNPYYAELVEPLRQELARIGHRAVLVADSSDDVLTADALSDGSYDGILVTTAARDSRLAADLRSRGIPHVFVNRTVDDHNSHTCGFAEDEGTRLIAELLTDAGHEHIVFLAGHPRFSTAHERETGLRTALRERSVRLSDRDVHHIDYTVDAGYAATVRILRGPQPPTAIVCGNDIVAIGALNAARDLGWNVPEDITVVAFDDIPAAGWSVISLTTVHCDLPTLARVSVQTLKKAIDGEEQPMHHRLGVQLVHRTSHGAPRGTCSPMAR